MSYETPPLQRSEQRVRFDLDDEATYIGSTSTADEQSGSDSTASSTPDVMSDGANVQQRRSRIENEGASPTRSIVQVGGVSVMMLLFFTISVAHLTIRYNSSETSTVPNFPDHLNTHLRGKEEESLELTPLVTADDNHHSATSANTATTDDAAGILVPLQHHVTESEDGEELKLLKVLLESETPQFSAAKVGSGDFGEDDSFDMYIFTMSYQPEFCYSHQSAEFPGCLKPNKNYTTHLTIHGLWPERSNGSWPQFCKSEDAHLDRDVIAELASQFTRLWPDEKNPHMEDPTQQVEFYEHEWAKHGTCTNMTQLEYFSAAFHSYIVPEPPAIIADYYGQEVPTTKLQAAFETATPVRQEVWGSHESLEALLSEGQDSSVVLICSGKSKNFLEEIRICYSNERGAPGNTMVCPKEVVSSMRRDICQGDYIRLAKFRSEWEPDRTSSSLDTLPIPVTDEYNPISPYTPIVAKHAEEPLVMHSQYFPQLPTVEIAKVFSQPDESNVTKGDSLVHDEDIAETEEPPKGDTLM